MPPKKTDDKEQKKLDDAALKVSESISAVLTK